MPCESKFGRSVRELEERVGAKMVNAHLCGSLLAVSFLAVRPGEAVSAAAVAGGQQLGWRRPGFAWRVEARGLCEGRTRAT